MDLKSELIGGSKRAAARLITMIENNDNEALQIIKDCFHLTGNSKVIGITGPPGSGKSTVTGRLVQTVRSKKNTAGVIAVDPNSPFTGGAILGDRVRMSELATDPGVFIRSMGTRGSLGGLSKATRDGVRILEILGMDYIFVETVGVGQSEIDISSLADITIMILAPGLGDDIQTLKAGIFEIVDIFAVNKSDKDGASQTAKEIKNMLYLKKDSDFLPPVINISAAENMNIESLLNTVEKQYQLPDRKKQILVRKKTAIRNEITDLLGKIILHQLDKRSEYRDLMGSTTNQVLKRTIDPYTAACKLIKIFKTVSNK